MPSFCAGVAALTLSIAAIQSPAPPAPAQQPSTPTLVITGPGWSDYHYPGCPRLAGESDRLIALPLGQANARGLKPHVECDPSRARTPGENAGKERKPGAKLSPARESRVVYILRDDRRYHRASCTRMGLGARAIQLDLLAPRYVPCPVCKPPRR